MRKTVPHLNHPLNNVSSLRDSTPLYICRKSVGFSRTSIIQRYLSLFFLWEMTVIGYFPLTAYFPMLIVLQHRVSLTVIWMQMSRTLKIAFLLSSKTTALGLLLLTCSPRCIIRIFGSDLTYCRQREKIDWRTFWIIHKIKWKMSCETRISH